MPPFVSLYRTTVNPTVYHRYFGCSRIKRARAKDQVIEFSREDPGQGIVMVLNGGEPLNLDPCANCGK